MFSDSAIMSSSIKFKSTNTCRKCDVIFQSTKYIPTGVAYCWDCDPEGEFSRAAQKKLKERSARVEAIRNNSYNSRYHEGTPAQGDYGDL